MSTTAAYFFGIFLGSVLTFAGMAIYKTTSEMENRKRQREAAQRRYRLEQRINQRENTHSHHRHD